MSEIASPAAVVEILITQNSAVTSGTFAANGCWLNTRSTERTLDGISRRASPSGSRHAVPPLIGPGGHRHFRRSLRLGDEDRRAEFIRESGGLLQLLKDD